MQSQCRTHRERGMFLGKKGAATKFQKFYRSFERNQVSFCCFFFFFSIQAMSHIFFPPPTTQLMFNWIEEVFTMVEVGDDGFVEDLLEFHEDVEEYFTKLDVQGTELSYWEIRGELLDIVDKHFERIER